MFKSDRNNNGSRQSQRSTGMAVESLESRQLMSTTLRLVAGTLTINSDSAISLYANPGKGDQLVIRTQTATLGSYATSSITRVIFNGPAALPSTFAVDAAINKPFTFNGGSMPDSFYGGSGADRMFGNGGSDQLVGGDGDDYLNGGEGGDSFYPGWGNDSVAGGAGDDAVSYYGHQKGITFNPNNNPSSGSLANGDRDCIGSDVENCYGTGYADTLYANPLTGSYLHGQSGNDRLIGSDKNDFLAGDAGSDSISTGRGSDRVNTVDHVGGNDTVLGDLDPSDVFTTDANDRMLSSKSWRFVSLPDGSTVLAPASDVVTLAAGR